MLKDILPLIPAHNLYVEVFCGGAAVFLAKNPSAVEVINDKDGDLAAFFWCCKFHLEELLRELDFVLNAREVFDTYLTQKGITDIQKAARWFIRNKLSFGGMGGTFAISRKQPLSSRSNRLLAIRSLSARLDRTVIENLDWEKCVEHYDDPEAFFFFDPPYFDAGGSAYAGWTELQLMQFAQRVQAMSAKWMVTFQDCDQVRAAFAGFRIDGVERANGIGNNRGTKGRKYREVVITSDRAAAGAKKGRTA